MVRSYGPKTCGKTNAARGARGAAIFIALAAALIVMLAVGILFTLMDRMISGQLQRERDAQIALSEASALEALVHSISLHGPLEIGSEHSFELAGVSTVFTVSGNEPVGPRTGVFAAGGDAVPLLVPSGRTLFAVTLENGLTVSVFKGSESGRQDVFRTDLRPDLALGCAGRWNGCEAVFLVLDTGDSQQISVVTRNGFVHSVNAPIEGINRFSVLSYGVSGETHLLAVSNGSNLGTVVNVGTGSAVRLISPVGTCPAVTPSGKVYGSPGSPNSFTLAPPVREVFFGDFNRDGREDIAWAGPRSMTCFTSTGLYSASPSPDAVLVAWGSIEGYLGLGAKWSLSGGQYVWTRLNHDGFGVFQPSGALEEPWSGRFYGGRTAIAGVLGNSVTMASLLGGYETVLLEGGEITWGDADGSDLDIFASRTAGMIEAVYNPLTGDGLAQLISVQSSLEGIRRTWGGRLLVYNASNGWKVFFEREGLTGQ